jgi:hypothetical protein
MVQLLQHIYPHLLLPAKNHRFYFPPMTVEAQHTFKQQLLARQWLGLQEIDDTTEMIALLSISLLRSTSQVLSKKNLVMKSQKDVLFKGLI